MKSIFGLFLIAVFIHKHIVSAHFGLTVPHEKQVFDQDLYESVLNPDLCEEQIRYIQRNDLQLLLECK